MSLDSMIELNPIHDLGVPVLDDQRRAIVHLVNYLVTSRRPEVYDGASVTAYTKLLHRLSEHFTTEEEILTRHGYPEIRGLVQRHEDHLGELARLRGLARARGVEISRDLVEYLREWWEQHLLVEDEQYREFLRAHPTP